jgi:ribosome-associated protein
VKKTAALDKAKLIAQLAAEKKGENIVLMDMRNVSTMYDWFVLVSASSSRRISAISNTIQRELSKEGISPLHVEGKHNPYWILLDYEDVVVHVFYRQIREFYGLERLWSDAPIERFDNKCLAKTSQKK